MIPLPDPTDPDVLLKNWAFTPTPMREEDYRVYSLAEIQAMGLEQWGRIRKAVIAWLDGHDHTFISSYAGAIDLRKWSCMWCARMFDDQVSLEAHEDECMG